MDAMMRRIVLLLLVTGLWCEMASSQQMNWNRLSEDTLYYGRDYLPDQHVVSHTGPAQIWDFRSLKAPYALSRRIIPSGERDGKSYANMVNGKQTDAIMVLNGKTSQIIQIIEVNPICPDSRLTYSLSPAYKPFFIGVLGEDYTYRGKMVSTFAWPRNVTCGWTPPRLPDSCRITVSISEEDIVDAEGTLYLPTEINHVYRHKVTLRRAMKVETLLGTTWTDVTSIVPGVRLQTTQHFLRFVAAASGLQLVEVEINETDQPIRVEFKTHPLMTRVFTEEPTRPDIFAYPNPSYGVVRFQLSDLAAGFYKLKLFNILGVPVHEMEVEVKSSRQTVLLDMSGSQKGTYLFRLQDKSGRTIKTKRVVLIQS